MATSQKQQMIAAYQGGCSPGNVQENLKTMKQQMELASKAGACLIVFPELYTTGYFLEPSQMRQLSEPQDGPTFKQLSQWSKELAIGVLYGYPELETSPPSPVYYNSAMFIASDGFKLGNYRKQHLWVQHEPEVFTPGAGSLVVTYKGIKMGVLICFDVEFPEAVRCLALEGVQLVLVPTALSECVWDKIPRIIIPARALENNIFVAYINNALSQNGRPFLGYSCVHGPNGEPVVLAGRDPCLMFANIDTSKCVKETNESFYLRERRPELYDRIVEK